MEGLFVFHLALTTIAPCTDGSVKLIILHSLPPPLLTVALMLSLFWNVNGHVSSCLRYIKANIITPEHIKNPDMIVLTEVAKTRKGVVDPNAVASVEIFCREARYIAIGFIEWFAVLVHEQFIVEKADIEPGEKRSIIKKFLFSYSAPVYGSAKHLPPFLPHIDTKYYTRKVVAKIPHMHHETGLQCYALYVHLPAIRSTYDNEHTILTTAKKWRNEFEYFLKRLFPTLYWKIALEHFIIIGDINMDMRTARSGTTGLRSFLHSFFREECGLEIILSFDPSRFHFIKKDIKEELYTDCIMYTPRSGIRYESIASHYITDSESDHPLLFGKIIN